MQRLSKSTARPAIVFSKQSLKHTYSSDLLRYVYYEKRGRKHLKIKI